jgi:heterodisulfide reductase subunit A
MKTLRSWTDFFVPWAASLSLGFFLTKGCHMSEKVFGSVLVIGGGIAGMQAALDAANSGYYVYLVERKPSIGGVMSQLDKTFPTNDCAM